MGRSAAADHPHDLELVAFGDRSLAEAGPLDDLAVPLDGDDPGSTPICSRSASSESGCSTSRGLPFTINWIIGLSTLARLPVTRYPLSRARERG